MPAIDDMFLVYQNALSQLQARIDDNFDQAVELIFSHRGNLIICGMGKSGLVGRKIAATLSSTGTPSVFLHPAEAMHGDLGILRSHDVIIAISNSGETEEIIRLLPAFRRQQAKIIALVGNISSTLARAADIYLDTSVDKEACPLNLAPTTSVLTALVFGDALAITLMEKRDFRPVDFAATHPGGKLGQGLLSTVADHMRTHDLPFVDADTPMSEVIIHMTEGRLGLAIVGCQTNLEGIITDGDLRRILVEKIDLSSLTAMQVMNSAPQTISADLTYSKAAEIMGDMRIQCLIVTSDKKTVEGVIQIF